MRFHRVLPRSHLPTAQNINSTISLITFAVITTSTAGFLLGQGETTATDDWVKQIAPGIRLVGQANYSGLNLPEGAFWNRTWSPDGKHLIGPSGRHLLVIDWDRREIAHKIVLPMNPGSSTVDSLLGSPDGSVHVVPVRWYGKPFPPEASEELEIDDQLESGDIDWQSSGTRLLVYDQDWTLAYDWALYDRLADIAGIDLSPGIILPDNKTLLLFGFRTRTASSGVPILNDPLVIAFDLKDGSERMRLAGVSQGYLISDHEMIFGTPLQIWDIRKNQILSSESIGLTKSYQVRAVDPDGANFVLYDPEQKEAVLWNRKTRKQTTNLSSVSNPNFRAMFTSDGKRCLINNFDFSDETMPHSDITVYDTDRQVFVAQAKLSKPLLRISVRPNTHSLIVGNINDSTIVEVPIDEHFPTELERSLNRLPIRGKLSYADDNKLLVLHHNNSVLTTDQEAKVIQRHSYDFDKNIYSPTTSQRIRIGTESWHAVESGKWTDEKIKVLYKIDPSAALSSLKALLGVGGGSRPSIHVVHLGFDPTGEIIRDLYIENSTTMRLRLSHASSGRKISETQMHPELDDSVFTRGTVSPDGQRLALINQQKLIVLDSKSGEVLREWDVATGIEQFALDHSGDHVAVAHGKRYWKSGDEVFLNRIQVYRVTTGEEVWSESNRGIQGFGFQPGTDRLYILTSGKENELRFFDRDTWQETWRHATAHAPAYGMAMSSTGHEVALGLRDSRVEFWKLSDVKNENR